jgi:hypothetical protein
MRRRIWLALCCVALSVAGCESGAPERPAGCSDERYASLLEQHRIAEQVHEEHEFENEHYLQQYGRLKYPEYEGSLPSRWPVTFGK